MNKGKRIDNMTELAGHNQDTEQSTLGGGETSGCEKAKRKLTRVPN